MYSMVYEARWWDQANYLRKKKECGIEQTVQFARLSKTKNVGWTCQRQQLDREEDELRRFRGRARVEDAENRDGLDANVELWLKLQKTWMAYEEKKQKE